jgi:hypothetical protein
VTGPTADGDGTVDPPPPGTMGLAVCGRPLHTTPLVLVVLDEQRAAVRTLKGRCKPYGRATPTDRPATAGDRARLMALGIELLAHAAHSTEADCRRIIGAAETHAASIVQAARDDVKRLPGWLASDHGAAIADPPPSPPTPPPAAVVTVRLADRRPPEPRGLATGSDGTNVADLGSGTCLGDKFFDSPPMADEDPWGFMDDDNLVGVGPALLRRVLRRPAGPRPQSLD